MKRFFTSILLAAITVMVQAQCVTTISSSTNVKCTGQCDGTATATAIGIPTYNYLWQPGGMTTASVTGLCAGNYTVTVVDGASCASSATVAITAPTPLSATSTQVNASCGGACNGSITAFASGGTSPYSHKWTTTPPQTGATATGLCAGVYRDSITDANGCKTVLGPVTITQPVPVTANVTCGSVSCFGGNNGTAAVAASGGSPGAAGYTYSWSTTPAKTTASISGLAAGTYSCTVTDSLGCSGMGSCTLSEPAALTYSTSSTNATCSTCCDGAASSTVTGGTPPYTYLWSAGLSTQNISGVCPGNYTVCITDANGCSQSSCSSVSVNFNNSINEYPPADVIDIYPNPSTGKFNLELLNNSSYSIKISNPLGQDILEERKTTKKSSIDLSDWPDGVYFLTITTKDGLSNLKIVLDK